MTPDQEARHIIKKIRRHVRLMNRKWVELNQRSNEWQHRIEAVLEVRILVFVDSYGLWLCPGVERQQGKCMQKKIVPGALKN